MEPYAVSGAGAGAGALGAGDGEADDGGEHSAVSRRMAAYEGHMCGNFWNYYVFNPPGRRIAEIEGCITAMAALRDLFRRRRAARLPARILDVGCNEGDLTVAFRDMLLARCAEAGQGVDALGVDVDAELVRRAAAKAPQGGAGGGATAWEGSVSFVVGDVTQHGLLASLVAGTAGGAAAPALARPVAVSTLFSVTMWIHLVHGDEGLVRLLREVGALSGAVLVEPQPPKCYRSARRRVRKRKMEDPFAWAAISDRDAMPLIDRTLRRDCGFDEPILVGTTACWERQLRLYLRGGNGDGGAGRSR